MGGAGRPLADRGLGTCGSPWAGPTHGPEHTAWDGEVRLRGTETCRLTLPAPLAAGPKTRGSGAGKRSAGGEGTGRFGRGRRCVCRSQSPVVRARTQPDPSVPDGQGGRLGCALRGVGGDSPPPPWATHSGCGHPAPPAPQGA